MAGILYTTVQAVGASGSDDTAQETQATNCRQNNSDVDGLTMTAAAAAAAARDSDDVNEGNRHQRSRVVNFNDD